MNLLAFNLSWFNFDRSSIVGRRSVFRPRVLVAFVVASAFVMNGNLALGADDAPTPTTMNASLRQVASIIGLLPVMEQITAMQAQFHNVVPTPSLEYLAKRQKLLYLREKENQILSTANLEVNATRGFIESDMAHVAEAQAAMVEKRARVLRRNTIINFVSGGLTKITGYSIALAGPDTPTNILEVVDGSVQCGLSGLTMKELHEENFLVKELPPRLAALNQSENRHVYPEQVWDFLNAPPLDGSGQTSRKEALAATWQQRGMMARTDKAVKLRAGTTRHHLALARIAPQLLEDRAAMLSELRSLVSEMHDSLMALSQICQQSFADDPSFDWPVAADPSDTRIQ